MQADADDDGMALPAWQAKHADRPVALANRPAGHTVHDVWPVAPTNVPGPQGKQAV